LDVTAIQKDCNIVYVTHLSWKRSADCMSLNRHHLIQEGSCDIKCIHIDFLQIEFFYNIMHAFCVKVFLNIGFHTSL